MKKGAKDVPKTKALAMGVGGLANETGDSHALRASERATRFNIL